MGKSTAKQINKESNIGVKFKDVAGLFDIYGSTFTYDLSQQMA